MDQIIAVGQERKPDENAGERMSPEQIALYKTIMKSLQAKVPVGIAS